MTINENRKYMRLSDWTSGSREIERIIVQIKKNNEIIFDYERRYEPETSEYYLSLLLELLKNPEDEITKYNRKEKYVCKIVQKQDELIAVVIRLK